MLFFFLLHIKSNILESSFDLTIYLSFTNVHLVIFFKIHLRERYFFIQIAILLLFEFPIAIKLKPFSFFAVTAELSTTKRVELCQHCTQKSKTCLYANVFFFKIKSLKAILKLFH